MADMGETKRPQDDDDRHQDSIFAKEYAYLQEAEMLVGRRVSHDELHRAYDKMVKNYKKLLRQTDKLTRTGDNQQRKLNRTLESLRRYVSSQLYHKVVYESEKVEIKTQRKKLTVFFSDLKDFSYATSHMESETLARFLNYYLEIMTQIIIKWGGTLDKYIGDAIMVFFGDPEFVSDDDHALRCVSMAVDMRDKMKVMRKLWYDMGFEEPLHARMGIATGYCTVGNFGSSERIDYTIFGAPVNLAARLEHVADVDDILIGHETWSYIKNKVACEPPRKMNLKGFHQAIMVHKVLYLLDEATDEIVTVHDDEKGVHMRIDFSKITKDELRSLIENMEVASEYQYLYDTIRTSFKDLK